MVVYGGLGVLLMNEEYVYKKNLVEDVCFGEMIEFLFIDERSVLENFKKDIKEVRRSLKDIKKLSGRSFEGIWILLLWVCFGVMYCLLVLY